MDARIYKDRYPSIRVIGPPGSRKKMRKLPGFGGFMMGLFGFTSPALEVTAPARFFLVKDKKALRAHLEKLAQTPSLARVDVGHGSPVIQGAAEALRNAAAEL